MEDPVVAQRFGSLDSTEAQHQRVQQSFQRFADTVAVVPLGEPDMSPKRTLQADPLEELLDQSDSAELRKADGVGGNSEFSGSTGQCCQPSLLVMFHNTGQNTLLRRLLQAFQDFSSCS